MILDRQKKLLHRKSQVFFIYLFLIILMLVSGIMNHVFFTARNFTNLITTALPYILVSFAQTLVILTGGIDLSVGAVVCVSNVICATLMKNDAMSFWMGLILALLSGIAIGAINGVIITKGRIQPIIVTLAMQTIFLGVALTILPSPGGSVDIAFASFVSGKILGIPVPLLIEIVLSIALWLLLNRTRFGTSVFAVGGNEDAAYSFGIMVTGRKISVYAIAGFLSALAGVFLTAQMYSGDPTVGTNFTMNSIATAVVGGTALSGGKGGIIGSIAGVFILIIINNFLNLVNVSSFYQYVLQGAILILALTISSLRTRR